MKLTFSLILTVLTTLFSSAQTSFTNTISNVEPKKETTTPKHAETKPAQGPAPKSKSAERLFSPDKSVVATASPSLSRKVLYTLEPNEDICYNEYYSNFNTKDNKFAIILRNPVLSKYYLVVNGEKLELTSAQDVYWLDIDSIDKCILLLDSPDGKKISIFIEGEIFGPYDRINYEGPRNHNCEDIYLKKEYKKHSFYYESNGNRYHHDEDGTIYLVTDDSTPTFRDRKGIHTVLLPGGERPYVIFDQTYYDLSSHFSIIYDVYVSEDGNCIIDTDEGFYALKDGSIQEYDNNKNHSESNNIITWSNEIDNGSARDFRDNKITESLDLKIFDKTGKHQLVSFWDRDFLLIDGKQIDSDIPVSVFYDEEANAFGWITFEGNNIMLNIYQL